MCLRHLREATDRPQPQNAVATVRLPIRADLYPVAATVPPRTESLAL